jgi:hypothetical protein
METWIIILILLFIVISIVGVIVVVIMQSNSSTSGVNKITSEIKPENNPPTIKPENNPPTTKPENNPPAKPENNPPATKPENNPPPTKPQIPIYKTPGGTSYTISTNPSCALTAGAGNFITYVNNKWVPVSESEAIDKCKNTSNLSGFGKCLGIVSIGSSSQPYQGCITTVNQTGETAYLLA